MTKRIVKKVIEEQGMSFEETKAEAIASMNQNLAEIRANQKLIDDELADIERCQVAHCFTGFIGVMIYGFG